MPTLVRHCNFVDANHHFPLALMLRSLRHVSIKDGQNEAQRRQAMTLALTPIQSPPAILAKT